jgi:hypothetical protein
VAVIPNLDVTKFRWIINVSTDPSSPFYFKNLFKIYMEKDRETQLKIRQLVNCINLEDIEYAKEVMNILIPEEEKHPKLRLKILGFHIGCIHTSAPGTFELSPLIDSDFKVKVEIKQVKIPEPPSIIDEVYFNSRYVGNRQGAVDKFIDLIIEQKPEIIME